MTYGCIWQLFGFLLFIINIFNCDGDYASLGSTIFLTCPYQGKTYDWYISSNDRWETPKNSNKYSNTNTPQLTIQNVDTTDDRDYLCRADEKYVTIHLYVVVNGGWSQWSGWSTCNVTCGYETSTRSRSCNNPVPANGGSDCSGSNTESQSCYNGNCPVNGGWSQWSGWSTCNVTCGYGTSTRSRSCNNPVPANSGSDCFGSNTETQSCNNGTCPVPVHGQWSDWSGWSNCSATCGYGSRVRYRPCTNPAPANGGFNCDGPDNQAESCNLRTCPDASQSASIIGPVAGGVSGGIVALVLVAGGLLIWTKSRKRSSSKQNQDYETPDIKKAELHIYEERQRHNSNAIELPVYGTTSETLSNKTFKTYNVRDFMALLQDKALLEENTKQEYQLLNVTADLTAAGDYEIIETTSGTATAEASENKSFIKKHDNGYGYIIRTVPGQSDIDIFWTEITDFRARNIVLLVHTMEQISEFFPATDVSVNTSKFKVELASSEKYPNNIFAFSLAVWNKDKKTEVQVKLYKTTDWKVGEKHPSIDTLCKLLDVVSYQESGLVAFLESDALSFRVCGCLGVCHEVIYAIKAERGFNIPQVAVDLKRMRPYLFQTYEEYKLCYKIIGHFLENQTTYAVID